MGTIHWWYHNLNTCIYVLIFITCNTFFSFDSLFRFQFCETSLIPSIHNLQLSRKHHVRFQSLNYQTVSLRNLLILALCVGFYCAHASSIDRWRMISVDQSTNPSIQWNGCQQISENFLRVFRSRSWLFRVISTSFQCIANYNIRREQINASFCVLRWVSLT